MPTPFLDRIVARIAKAHAAGTTRRFLRAVQNANQTQDALLASILRPAADSAFGREHGFGSVRGYRDFAARVPVRGYDTLAAWFERVWKGETSALLPAGERVLMFAMTSGTTARPKYIPITSRVLADCRRGWNIWGLAALLDHPACIMRHIVQVTSPMEDHRSPAGVPCGAITGLLAATQKRLVRKYYTSPLAVSRIADPTLKYYTIMRLAIPRDVSWMVTANPATLLALARVADEHKASLIRDIHDGSLTGPGGIDNGIRAELAPRLTADAACADRLEQIVARSGRLCPRDYWRLGFVAHWTGGTMGLYRPQFAPIFGSLPARDVGLIASEGRMSIPLSDERPAGVLEVTSQFFEFIPAAEYGGNRPTVLRSHEVTEGEDYFLVLTNAGGLYRYDIGDRVRVVDRMGEAPLIEFLSRDAHTASMAGEKLTEDQVVLALRSLQEAGGEDLARCILAPVWADVPYYRLYIAADRARTTRDAAARLDEALSRVNVEYESKRKSLRLGPLQVAALPPEVLAERDRRLRTARSRNAEQFKHQYLLPAPGLDADLAPHARPALDHQEPAQK